MYQLQIWESLDFILVCSMFVVYKFSYGDKGRVMDSPAYFLFLSVLFHLNSIESIILKPIFKHTVINSVV